MRVGLERHAHHSTHHSTGIAEVVAARGRNVWPEE
jgi:hypothetical protein